MNLFIDFSILFISAMFSGTEAFTTEPEFTEMTKNVTIPVGRDVKLSCSVSDLRSYQMAWIKVDSQTILSLQTQVITHDGRIRVTHSNYKNWFLHIGKVRFEDRGYYMCQINTKPMRHQVMYLDVVVPPDITDDSGSSDIVVREFESLSVHCKASGYPTPEIEWQREDGRKIRLRAQNGRKVKLSRVSGSSFNISKVTRDHMGAYLCMASNGVPPPVSRRINVRVEFTPKIRVPNEIVGASMRSDVVLECIVESYPPPLTSWTTNDTNELIVSNNNKYETTVLQHNHSYKIFLRLKIKNMNKKDFKTFKCSASNTLGKTDGFIKVYEIIPISTSTLKSGSTERQTSTTISDKFFTHRTKSGDKRFDFGEKIRVDSRTKGERRHQQTTANLPDQESPEDLKAGDSYVDTRASSSERSGSVTIIHCGGTSKNLTTVVLFSAIYHLLIINYRWT